MGDDFLRQALEAHQKGDLIEAERFYQIVLRANPDHADALALSGLLKQAQGDLKEALRLISRAVELDSGASLFRFYLGNVLFASGNANAALLAYRAAINLAPNRPEGHFGMANVYLALNEWERAEGAFRDVLRLQPAQYEARNSLAIIHDHNERFDEACTELKQVVQEAPFYGEAWLNLCNIAEKTGDYQLSCVAGFKATELMPQNDLAWFGLGVALNRLERDEEAVVAYHNALKLEPTRGNVWENLGKTYQFLNRVEEAQKAFLSAVEAEGQSIKGENDRRVDEQEYGAHHWHLALIDLLRGEYVRGFARYRARFGGIGGLKRPPFTQPLWQGENLCGKTLLVMDEQGFGDTLMMARYLPLIRQSGAVVKLSVHQALVPFLTGWGGAHEVYERNTPVESFDYYASVFDLPYAMATALETIPAQVPYLPILSPDSATQLPETDRPKIGVVWGGAPAHKHDLKRSIPLALFKEIFEEDDFQFFSFNRDKREGDDKLLVQTSVVDLAPRLKDFADASRLIAQMDLIITCDTGTAHLAGGMGKKVWTLLPFAPDWRWLMDREDSPWYPTMRLFRQEKRGDWAGVVARVRQALQNGV